MKQLLFLTLLAVIGLLSCKTTHTNGSDKSSGQTGGTAQRAANDSVNYVEGIKAAKAKYLNKEFAVLLNDLKMPVKSYSSHFNDRITTSGILISFNDQATTVDKSEGVKDATAAVQLFIEWENPILRSDVEAQLKTAAGDWHEAEQHFYAPRIVKDIR